MFTRSLLLSFCAVLLVGCTGRGFQPPAPDYTKWYKEGVSQTGIIAAQATNAKITWTCASSVVLANRRCATAAVNPSPKGHRE